jgi:RHS repeat-associated protein
VFNPAEATYTYSYDATGIRRLKFGPNVAAGKLGLTAYTYSQTGSLPQLLEEQGLSSGPTTDYIYGPQGPIEQTDGTTTGTQYLHHDQQGSTRLVTDNTGAPIDAITYDPYGNKTNETNPFGGTKLGYTGEYTDPETGFIYLRNRYYDPLTSQYLSRDPLNAWTRSAYGYVYSDPLNMRDPSGLCGLWGDDSCIGNAIDGAVHELKEHTGICSINDVGCETFGREYPAARKVARVAGDVAAGTICVVGGLETAGFACVAATSLVAAANAANDLDSGESSMTVAGDLLIPWFGLWAGGLFELAELPEAAKLVFGGSEAGVASLPDATAGGSDSGGPEPATCSSPG